MDSNHKQSLYEISKDVQKLRVDLDTALSQVQVDGDLILALQECVLKLLNWTAAWSLYTDKLPMECRYEIDTILNQARSALERWQNVKNRIRSEIIHKQ